MSRKALRFATCTPVAFHANEYFYTRDTGLICKELQKQGLECRVIMPLPAHDDDIPTTDLLRVPPEELHNTAWWRSLDIDAVILYSWGDPRYTQIARAIRKAGLKLIIHFDSSGELHEHLHRPGIKLVNKAKDILVNQLRRLHLSYAHCITSSAPCIMSFQQDACYGLSISEKCKLFPTPVDSCFRFNGMEKQARIICTGSWHIPVKRAGMLMRTLEMLLNRHPVVQVDICGTATPELQEWHRTVPMHMQARIHLHGMCSHEQLSRLYNVASISLCTSESEGSHGASAEALCCGCSIVCPPRPLLSVVRWYTSRNSGLVSEDDTPDSLSQALYIELENWQKGLRNASEISKAWQSCFNVATLPSFL